MLRGAGGTCLGAPDSAHRGDDLVRILQRQLGHAYLSLIDLLVDLGLDLRLDDMEDRQPEGFASERPRPCGITFGDGERVEPAAGRRRGAQKND
jgi:hypothetical protein